MEHRATQSDSVRGGRIHLAWNRATEQTNRDCNTASSSRCASQLERRHPLKKEKKYSHESVESTSRRHYDAPVVVSKIPSEVVALARYRGLQFSSLYLGRGESPPRERGGERAMLGRANKARLGLKGLGLLRRVPQFLGKILR